jgi:adenosylmethionine-8-amino-7-oxononanoate aminotransferase
MPEADPVYHKTWGRDYPIAARAEGVYVFDREGRAYLDAVGGSFVVSIGHGVREVTDAMAEQARQVSFPYVGDFTTEAELHLAREVLSMAPPGMAKVFAVSGGSEANEVAIKLARKYQLARGRSSRWRIVGRWQSYHGATLGAMSASGHSRRRGDFQPYLLDFPHIGPPYCYRCPWHLEYPSCQLACADDLEVAINRHGADTIAAFICEPIGGAADGAVVPPMEYLGRIREICDRYDILLITDEVITGFGRTGANFAVDHFGVTPDLITCGKGLGSGYAPIGAVVIHEKVVAALESTDGSLFTGYTYSGHPIACAAGTAVLQYVKRNGLVQRARQEEPWLRDLIGQLASHPSVGDIRGKGFLIGIELVADRQSKRPFPVDAQFGKRVVKHAWDLGMVIRCESGTVGGVAGDHLLLAPPLVTSRDDLTKMWSILDQALTAAELE